MKLSLGGGLEAIARSFTNAENPFNTKSANFNGTDQFVDTNYQTDATFQTSYSISFWIKPTDGRPSSSELIFSMANTTASNGTLQITLNTTGTIEHSITAGGQTEADRTSGAFSNGPQSDWFHFVFTVDMSAKTANTIIYADGVVVGKVTVSNGGSAGLANFAADQDFQIGCRQGSDGSIDKFFTGLMDEFAVFTTVLDADSVAKIYNNGVAMDLQTDDGDYDNSGDLELYYRFEDNLTDTTGTSNGTSTASPTFDEDVPA